METASIPEGFQIQEGVPTAQEYVDLRRAVGFRPVDIETCGRGLRSNLFGVVVRRGDEIAGMGRIVGDGAVYLYIQDIIVRPEFQGLGLGRGIMDRVMEYVMQHIHENPFVGLMAAVGAEEFYERYGFSRRPDDAPGMCLPAGFGTS